MQLVDELSMIYTTCIMFYAIFSHGRSIRSSILLFLLLVALAAFITGYYHYLQDPLFHQNMFALLTCIVVFRSMYAMEKILRSSRRAKDRALHQPPANGYAPASDELEQSRVDQRDGEILRTMWMMIAYGVSAVAGGFLIWNLDNIFCPTLRRWRREVGLPWGILLEGHGWW
jgi:dihydroceramidase